MKHTAFSLLVFALGLSAPLHAEIEVIHDSLSNKTTVRTKPKASMTSPSILVLGSYGGGQPVVSIILATAAKSWRYRQCHQTQWLVDDQPFQLPQPNHYGSVGSGYVSEYLVIDQVPLKKIEQLAQAKKVEFKLCNDEYTATTEEVKDFGIFLSKLHASAPHTSP
jgi:hypothetical protein